MTDREILALEGGSAILKAVKKVPLLPESIMKQTGLPKKTVQTRLAQMEAAGMVVRTKKGKYGTPRSLGLFTGRIQGFSSGYGFLLPDRGDDDIYIPREGMNGALSGDIVLASARKDDDGRWDGEVLRILVRGNPIIVGVVTVEKGYSLLQPDDRRITAKVRLCSKGLQDGDRVVARVTDYDTPHEGILDGVVEEVLASKDDPAGPMLMAMVHYDIPRDFSAEALAEADKLPEAVSETELAGRRDLREEIIFTIDGIDARDFDDAISLQKTDDGWRLGVHIADVSYYVRPDSAIDREAYTRGTSVYFPGRVAHMLPEVLSTGICSLKPDVDRLALSVEMDIDSTGQLVAYTFFRSVIHSKERLVYSDINKLYDGDEDMRLRYAHILPTLEEMRALYEKLHSRRKTRGSIDFELPESRILLGEDGYPVDVVLAQRGLAERLIEEFMLVANEAAARLGKEEELPLLYRVHESPEEFKMRDLADFVATFGYKLAVKDDADVRPKQLQQLLIEAQGKPEETLIANLTLRSMQKARYDVNPLGHFGLAVRDYCHFTSPIRRYPDLLVHRAITGYLRRKKLKHTDLREEAAYTSLRERMAMEAERSIDSYMKVLFMQRHVGAKFAGTISGVTKFGLFVMLENTIEGLVHISTLDGHFQFERDAHRLRCKDTTYTLGDSVVVRVENANPEERALDFTLVFDE